MEITSEDRDEARRDMTRAARMSESEEDDTGRNLGIPVDDEEDDEVFGPDYNDTRIPLTDDDEDMGDPTQPIVPREEVAAPSNMIVNAEKIVPAAKDLMVDGTGVEEELVDFENTPSPPQSSMLKLRDEEETEATNPLLAQEKEALGKQPKEEEAAMNAEAVISNINASLDVQDIVPAAAVLLKVK